MANRNLQAKMLKLKKQRRALPKHYQHVFLREGKDKDPRDYPRDDDPKDYKDSVRYRARARGISEELAETNFVGVPPARKQAIEMMKKVVALGNSTFFTIVSNSHHECRVFYNSERTVFMVVYVNYVKRTLQRSIEYSSKERVNALWESDKIRWVEYKHLPAINP
jgi:hypothetical protein